MDGLTDGQTVEHKVKEYVVSIVGKTRMSNLFEVESDDWEYRVKLEDGTIRIASPSNLTTWLPTRSSHKAIPRMVTESERTVFDELRGELAFRVLKSDRVKDRFIQVQHPQFHDGVGQHWMVWEDGIVPAKSVCWFFCWGKPSERISDHDTAQVRSIFDSIFEHSFEWLDLRMPHDLARQIRYMNVGKAEKIFWQEISKHVE